MPISAIEMVIFEVDIEARIEFYSAYHGLIAKLSELPGFINENLFIDDSKPNRMVCILWWQDHEKARNANQAFKSMTEASAMMKYVKRVESSGVFQKDQNDPVEMYM